MVDLEIEVVESSSSAFATDPARITNTEVPRNMDEDNEDTVSTATTLADSSQKPAQRDLGLDINKKNGWSGSSYDDYE